MKKLTYTCLAVAVVALILGGIAFFRPATLQTILQQVGANPGNEYYNPAYFYGGFGGKTLATSTSGTATTLTEGTLADYSVIEMTPNVASFTYTFPASSTMTTLLKDIGASKDWIFMNGTTTAGVNLVLAAGTGINFSSMGSTTATTISGGAFTAKGFILVRCFRQVNKDVNCGLFKETQAD